MFGASVSELYLLIKSLFNIGRAVDLCVIRKKKIYSVLRNCESGLAMIYKHAAHRRVQHMLQVVEVALTDDSTLAIFFYMRYRSSLLRTVVRGWSPVTLTQAPCVRQQRQMASTHCHAVMSIALAIV